MLKRTILSAIIAIPSLSFAELYKCSLDGQISYQDRPCLAQAERMSSPKVVSKKDNPVPGLLEGLQAECTMDTIQSGWEIVPDSKIVFFCGEYSGVTEEALVEAYGPGRIEKDETNSAITRHYYTSENQDVISIAVNAEKGGVVSGNLTPSEARKQEIERKENAEERERKRMRMLKAIGLKKILIGMTKDQARLSWGNPTKINRSSYGPEQWVYRRGSNTQYIYFEDGVVSAWN